eukprot:COSAG01_NODE_13748_length_1541_cov_1.613731_2_plen_217_part_00
MPDAEVQTDAETCHECAETVTRIIDEANEERDQLTKEFVESKHMATDFQTAAETIEYYLGQQRMQACDHKRALVVCELRFPNISSRYDPSTGGYLYVQNNQPMTTEAADAMKEHECFKIYRKTPCYSYMHTLKLYVNKCGRKKLLPPRVVLNLQLAIQDYDRILYRSILDSVGRAWMIKQYTREIELCDQMKDILWTEDLLLPLVHPRKRRRISQQ